MFGRVTPIFGITVALFMSGYGTVQASLQVGQEIQFANGPGTPGGIFFIENLTAPGELDFDTVCVQLEEHVAFGPSYLVDSISESTVGSGGRALTSFAAWLYDSYLDEALTTFDFSIKHAASAAATTQANQLQTAIWHAMGYTRNQIGQGYYDAYIGNYDAWEDLFDADVLAGNWVGTGDIHVMNLLGKDSSGNYTVHAQDQLVRVPGADSGLAVPEPISLGVWCGLVVGALIARRRCRPNG